MTLHQLFLARAKEFSSKLAIIDRTTEKRITYEKAAIAAIILSKKIKKYNDGFIGVMIPTSAGCMLSVLGILLAGKVPVMINYATGAAENALYAQKKCGFTAIITSKALLEKIGCRFISGMIFIEDILQEVTIVDKLKSAMLFKLPFAILKNSFWKGNIDDNLVILFTSGSEKEPKAVQLTHRNILSNIDDFNKVFDFSQKDIMLANLPLFHVFGFNVNFWLPVATGMTIVSYANPLEYRTICKIVREENVSVMVGTPSFFNGYLRQSERGDFASVRIAIVGADKCPDSLREGFLAKHNLVLLEGYGTTETSPVISVNNFEFNKPGSIGKPLPSVQVKIIDINSGELLPAGKEGKILVRGDNVMKGYFDDLEETSLRIRDGWYDTGDMGMLDEEGYLWHRGRLKRFVKIGGEMVSLVKVEQAVAGFISPEAEFCVVEIPDALKGAKIVLAINEEIDFKKLIKKLQDKLPQIALPRDFVLLEELPKMGSGKIDFRQTTDLVRKKLLQKHS